MEDSNSHKNPLKQVKKRKKGFFNSPLNRNKKSSTSSSKVDKSKSAADLTNVGVFGERASAPIYDDAASEAARRAERDRRLRLQEEQDLAYAIALSKAEAASLQQN